MVGYVEYKGTIYPYIEKDNNGFKVIGLEENAVWVSEAKELDAIPDEKEVLKAKREVITAIDHAQHKLVKTINNLERLKRRVQSWH